MNKISHISKATVTSSVTVVCPEDHNNSDGLKTGDDLHLLNGRTGEILESWTYDGRAKPKPNDWIRLFQEAACDIVRDKRLTPMAVRVFLEVLGKAGFGNSIQINHTRLAKDLGCSRESVSRAAACLVSANIIERLTGKKNTYRLNPNYAWKGKREWQHGRAKGWSEKRAKLTVKDDSNADQLPHRGAEVCRPP